MHVVLFAFCQPNKTLYKIYLVMSQLVWEKDKEQFAKKNVEKK